MERLTQRIEGYLNIWGRTALYEAVERPGAYLNNAIVRLAAYEDTGLTPEDVGVTLDLLRCYSEAADGMGGERVRELSRAEKEGRLVVLPCKVGDTLYDIYEAMENGGGEIKEHKVNELNIRIDRRGKVWLIIDQLYFSLSDFGKTVFLTRQEAEEALGKEDKPNA